MPRWLPIASVLLLISAVFAVPPVDPAAKPKPNPDAQQALAQVRVDPGLKVSIWATEPLFANPVAFTFDELGNAYFSETTRINKGVPDTRGHMYWLDEDLACRTVADRLAMYKKHSFRGDDKLDDQVRKVWDSDGDGIADKSSIFSNGYNQLADGIASGVLARKGAVYFTNIPSLYRLRDTNGDHTADQKTALSTGYGVRVQYIGHDLHGLRMGPDGKLYFTIGDRGLHVVTPGGTVSNPDSGSVLRCNPDGSELEIIHVGLRNPQELAFDDFGNLFTYDNNSDSGDRARWVQIVEGGDSGWRAGYQYGSFVHHDKVPQGNRGPWNTEKIWHVPNGDDRPPAYVVPPLLHFGNGPSGITHYPGIGLSDRYKDHFFACDFTGGSGGSVIWSLGMKPKGASFEVVDLHPFVRQMLPTDCEFGPDGAFYWSDWTSGWGPNEKGRLFRLTDPEAMKNPAVAEAKKLLAEGFEKRGIPELAKLLGHPHQLVRQEAQFELASRPAQDAIPALCQVAKNSPNTLARLHAVWGLGMFSAQLLHAHGGGAAIAARVQDAEVPVRVAAIRVLGQRAFAGSLLDEPLQAPQAVATLKTALTDPDARIQAAAAVAYGRVVALLGTAANFGFDTPLFRLLAANQNQDAYVRQAAVQGLMLVHQADKDHAKLYQSWVQAGKEFHATAVRLGVVLALRKLKNPDLAHFLTDEDPQVIAEAARAIYAENVTAALPRLAELAAKPGRADPVAYRALAASYRLGTPADAARVAGFAARSREADHLRICALKLLADWAKPPRRDPIHGLVHDLPPRDASAIARAIEPMLAGLFTGSDAVRSEAVKMVKALNVTGVAPLMAGLVEDGARPASIRAEALFALDALKAKELATATAFALKSDVPKLRAAARVIRARADTTAAAREIPQLLDDAKLSVIEKQMLFDVLGSLKESAEVDRSLAKWLDRYREGQVPPELQLDVLEAARSRVQTRKLKLHADLKGKLAAIDKAAQAAESKDPLARSRETLQGGDADRGRSIFLNNAAVYCQRCHKLDNQGGEVGPLLNGIARDKNREYLLTAILKPNAAIAKGYESVLLNTIDGKVITGVLRSKTPEAYTVVTGEGKVIVVPADDVDSARPDKSAMPDDLAKKLSPRELRDLVEFLSALKEPLAASSK